MNPVRVKEWGVKKEEGLPVVSDEIVEIRTSKEPSKESEGDPDRRVGGRGEKG